MARVFQYVRPVNAVLTSIDLGNKTRPSADGVRIKEEPPDFDDLSPFLTDVDTVTQNASTKHARRRSNTVSIGSNERNLIRETVASSKNDSDTSRKKRKRNTNDDLDSQCVERKTRRRTIVCEIKDVPSKDITDEVKNEVLCDVCLVPFLSKAKLSHHTQRYRTLMVCEYCSAPFNFPTALYRHQLVHFRKYGPAPRAKLECYFCERRFDRKERVQMHLFHCHANLLQSYMCDADNGKTSTGTKDTALSLTSDVTKSVENSRMKVLPAGIVNNVEGGICREDTTTSVINRPEKNTSGKETTEQVINNADVSACRKDTTVPVIDSADKSTCMEDSTMYLINSAEETTHREDTTERVINNAEETTHREDTTERVINNAEETTLREDTTEHVINNVEARNHVEETSSSTCAKDTTMRTTDNGEEPAEDTFTNDTTLILDHVDKMKQNTRMEGTQVPATDDTEGDTCREETIITGGKDTSMDDTMTLGESDVQKLSEKPMEEIMNIIGVSKNVEENTLADNGRNCVPNNSDKIAENISTANNSSRAVHDVNKMEDVDTIEQDSSIKLRRRSVKKDNKVKQPTSTGVSTNRVPENDGKTKENMQTKNTVMTKTSNAGKENPPIKSRKRRKMKVNEAEKNSSKQRRSKVNTETKDVQNSSPKVDTYLLNDKIKIEPAEPEDDDCLIIDVENVNEVTSTKSNITCSTENIDKSHRKVGHTRNTDEKIDTEMLVSSTVPTYSFGTASPSTAPSSTMSPSTVTSTTPKKLRQTTLMEFLSFSGKNLNQTALKTEKEDETEPSSSVSVQNKKTWKPVCTSTPLSSSSVKDTVAKTSTDNASTPILRMHMDPDSMINLLTDQIKSETVDDYDSNVSQNSPYNLRKTKTDSCRSSPNLHGTVSPNIMSAKRRKRTTKQKLSLQEKLKAKYNCKDCVVRLERCDYTSKRVVFKTDMTKSSIPLQLTIGGKGGRDLLSGKQTNTNSPTIRIVKLENCIVVEVMESR
ncbi:uncharacterized protein LOC105664190 [Megachile rotundata]|uniref:uncharacterized protein LOC105664190 n=1 Tax=Megachile rotundata TaxID=143995 RepID=UPI003FD47959